MSVLKFLIPGVLSLGNYLSLIRTFKKKSEKGFYPVNMKYFFDLISKNEVKFIQIGANDGQLNDPIYPYIKGGKWKGILVEPLPPLFAKLKITYSGIDGLVFENVGITEKDGEMDFYFLPAEYNEPDWLQQIGTFDKKAIELNLAHIPEFLPKVDKTTVSTLSLSTLFKKNNIKSTDIFIIDAEGFEYKILKQLGQLDVKPKYIFFEWGCLEKEEYDKLIESLEKQDYMLYQSGGDLLAIKNKI